MRKKLQKVTLNPAKTVLIDTLFKQFVPSDVIVRENPRTITHYHSYGGLSKFFDGLTNEILYGTLCLHDRATGIWLPPRVHCPDCWETMIWAPIDFYEACVYTHSTTNLPGAGFQASVPCPLISIEIPGVCTKFMSYLSEGEPYIGMPIEPVFRTKKPTYTILDISWIPRKSTALRQERKVQTT
ncbi:MAG: hypothetical protein U1A23_03840 [Candidatus Sungbacteria bacterium]|nr:hypothetical protein [bacterium]MDZ4286034.1 hypothetical protein [Candidatus Sungbacteria bacterium]